jgi:putative lipoprotein
MKTATLLLLSLLFALPAQAAERQPYTCDNGSRLDISFAEDAEGRPQATLHFADEAMILPQVPAASGALYRKGDIRLHTRRRGIFRRWQEQSAPLHARHLPPAVAAVAQPATSSFIEIGGTVSYLARIALPPDAILIIRVLDTARAGAPARVLVEQRYELNGAQVPIPFSATIDRDLIGKKARLSVNARIEQQGKLRFISDRAYPPLKDGQPVPVDIVLKPAGRAPR